MISNPDMTDWLLMAGSGPGLVSAAKRKAVPINSSQTSGYAKLFPPLTLLVHKLPRDLLWTPCLVTPVEIDWALAGFRG